MLNEVLRYLKNYFVVPGKDKRGNFTIENGEISLPFLQEGQYFLVEGSVFNNGVHKYPASDLVDERFYGRVCPLSIPVEVITISEEISQYCAKYGEPSAFQSESFGGYSYTRATSDAGGAASWVDAFKSQLRIWKKI